eukprot:11443841-Ditylum_brightwellii.AAC.1
MSSGNGLNNNNGDGVTTSYHSKFNPPLRGKQRNNDEKKPAAHRWMGPQRTNRNFVYKDNKNPEKEENKDAKDAKKGKTINTDGKPTPIKIDNKASDNDEKTPISNIDMLSTAARNATGVKVMSNYKTRNIVIGGSISNNKWSAVNKLLLGNKFSKHFTTHQETRKEKPQIVMYANIKTAWRGTDLKGGNGVLQYLRKHNIFLQIDQFNAEETGIAGFILKIHGTLVKKAELTKDITEVLEKVQVLGDKIVDKRKAANGASPDSPKT